jgi:hypothetical protein
MLARAGVCVQARISSAILERLSNITMLSRLPATPFETFALGRYEGRLHEAMENGLIKQEQLQELTQEDTVRQYIESQREVLEKEFATLMAVDEIFKREGLTVDESQLDAQLEPQREEFKKAGKIATVRTPLPSALVMPHTLPQWHIRQGCAVAWVPPVVMRVPVCILQKCSGAVAAA